MTVILLRGEIKISDQNLVEIERKSLDCESQNIRYPFAEYDSSKSKELKITANFRDDAIEAVSLVYILRYDNGEQVKDSESSNHADMNVSFGRDGLGADALNAHYSRLKDSMQMSLYAKESNLDLVTAKYFMIKTDSQIDLPVTSSEYRKNYEEQSFVCTD